MLTNEELKKKICKIIAPYVSAWGDDERIADALIAAGIGDVKEAEHRAEVAEKAGRIIQREMTRVFDVSKPRVRELIANIWDLAKKQAEKELTEEKR